MEMIISRYRRYLLFSMFVLQTLLGINLANKSFIESWQLVVSAACSSYFLAAALTTDRDAESAQRYHFRLVQVGVFITSLCLQLAIQQAIRS